MLSLHSARERGSDGRIGLAIAGGGPIGGMYELGALRAMDEAMDGLDLTRMDCYVGVSSGAWPRALGQSHEHHGNVRIFITGTSDDAQFRPEIFLKPNVGEYLRRAATLPGLYADWARRLMLNPRKATRVSDLILRFGGLLPTGLFDNQGVEAFLHDIFTRRGRSSDFRTRKRTCSWSRWTWTAAKPCASAKAGTRSRFPRPCGPAPHCRDCIRR